MKTINPLMVFGRPAILLVLVLFSAVGGSVLGKAVTSPYPTVPYTFATAPNNVLLDNSTDTITFRP